MALSMLAETHRAARHGGSMRGGAGYHASHAGPKTWLGMKVKDEKQGACTGARVTEITANGPAERVGFRPCDVILGFDGQRICGNDHLIEEVRASDVGATPEIMLRRGSERMVLQPTLAEMPPRVLDGLRPDER
jgi:S1-C subfamily serine protease